MGIVPPPIVPVPVVVLVLIVPAPAAPMKAAGFSVMNCVPSLVGAIPVIPMIVFGAASMGTRVPAAAALVVGMYVTGRKVVGQDWFPGAAAATSWIFASC